ncbi:hypothetical protein LINPERHAP1_LOCUS234 [Linum perenne]
MVFSTLRIRDAVVSFKPTRDDSATMPINQIAKADSYCVVAKYLDSALVNGHAGSVAEKKKIRSSESG